MSVLDTLLFCLADERLFSFQLTRPNGPFFPVAFPDALVNETLLGFVADRDQRTLYLLTQDERLHRVSLDTGDHRQIFWPQNRFRQSDFGPMLYDPPTDRVVMTTPRDEFFFWIGLDAWWDDVSGVLGATNTSFSTFPYTTGGLRVMAFSAGSVLAWSGLVMVVAALVVLV